MIGDIGTDVPFRKRFSPSDDALRAGCESSLPGQAVLRPRHNVRESTAVTPSGAFAAGRARGWRFEFRHLALVAVAATYGLIVLGGVVRSTGSGTACPDWPLCKGEVIPPFETKVMIEYTHRVVASLVGVIIAATVLWAWRRRRADPAAARVAAVTLLLLALQVGVGGITVGTETNSAVVAIHLSIALSLLSALIVLAAKAHLPGETLGLSLRKVPREALASVTAVFALIIVGAFVSQEGAGLAYPDWPLFDGKLTWASSKVGELHYAHRLVAAGAGAALAWLVIRMLRRERDPVVLAAVVAAFALYVAQVFVGASNIWFDLPTSLRILHLALASLLWAVLLFGIVWSQLRDANPPETPAA